MRTHSHGRHEFGQNFLIDPATIGDIVALVAGSTGPIVEIGPGDGALTFRLERLGRPLTAVEIDPRRAARLSRRTRASTAVVNDDFLRFDGPASAHVLVGNLPFHQTTATLRRILHSPGWTEAVLLVQWEVARRRAGVGGATMMTAQWWPWFAFRLGRRVPASAFRPRPGVDGGVIVLARRAAPLVADAERRRYQGFVHRVFTGAGRGLAAVLAGVVPGLSPNAAERRLRADGLGGATLPKHLTAEQWASLYRWYGARTGGGAPVQGRRGGRGRSR